MAARSGESPPRYGRQKTSDSANTPSAFSQETQFEHQDSATLYGDRFNLHGKSRFKARGSAPKLSCPLKGTDEPEVSFRPPPSPNTELYMSPGRQSTPTGRRFGASPDLLSEKDDTDFIEARALPRAQPPPRIPPGRTGLQQSPPPLSASSAPPDKRNLRYYMSDTDDIMPPSSSPDFWIGDIRENDSRRRAADKPRSRPSLQPLLRAVKSFSGKHHGQPGTSASREKRRNIKTLCCNIATEFPNRVPPTYSQNYSGKQPPARRQQPLRTLAAGTFNTFINQDDVVGVMFHNSATNKPGSLEDLKNPIQSSLEISQMLASVDCAKEASLCAREGVSKFPFFKFYSRGSTVKEVEQFGDL
ncbi:hypothetical protein BsWGS_17009 [Bradybaena similaris]